MPTGTVNMLDATSLDDPKHEYAGKVLVTIVCDSIEEGRAWADLYGKRIEARALTRPREPAKTRKR